jgi:hypothetical protein
MAAKKKKKKPPGGATGAPPRSEPRMQIFTKFAGCNFQLATRNFDDLFAEDQDAQTDLMPMLMAIQNNAHIAPFGGIETRQNLVELFTVPTGKLFTGVSTLIGDRLYAACDDMTVHHGALPAAGVAGNLTSNVTLTDLNASYGAATRHDYTGSTVSGSEVASISQTEGTSVCSLNNHEGIAQTFMGLNFMCTAYTFYLHSNNTYHGTVEVMLFKGNQVGSGTLLTSGTCHAEAGAGTYKVTF